MEFDKPLQVDDTAFRNGHDTDDEYSAQKFVYFIDSIVRSHVGVTNL